MVPSNPTDVQLTRMSAGAARATGVPPICSQSAWARAGVRFQTRTSLAPASSKPHTAARALPPAPSTSAVLPAAESGSASIRAGASVLSASMLSSEKVRVFAAPIPSARDVLSVASFSAASLCGIVTLAPRKPAAGSALTVS